jgi:GT2 family glycosyltransferase
VTSARTPAVGLVTIWYRSGGEIDRVAAELQALAASAALRLRPVFVVHALEPTEVAHLRAAVPQALVLEPGRNLGPAAGWNLAIRRLLDESTDYIAVRNVDTHFAPDCLARLLDVLAANPAVAAVQPLLCDAQATDRVQMYGGAFDPRTGRATHAFKGARISDPNLPATREADYLDGGSLLMRAAALRQVGGFDERLFMYGEDCDLSLRLRQAGYRLLAVRDARAWHAHAEGRGHLPSVHEVFYSTRNRFLLVRSHATARDWWALALREVAWKLPRAALFYMRRGRRDLAWAHACGVMAGLVGRIGNNGWVT